MLSRTADHLYWMARYIERAENMARVLEVTYSMSLVPNAAQSEAALWLPALEIAGNVDQYEEEYGSVEAANVIHYLSMDVNNPTGTRRRGGAHGGAAKLRRVHADPPAG